MKVAATKTLARLLPGSILFLWVVIAAAQDFSLPER